MESEAQEVSPPVDAYDRGWQDGKAAAEQAQTVNVNEARFEAFQKGYKLGFKEGREVGRAEHS